DHRAWPGDRAHSGRRRLRLARRRNADDHDRAPPDLRTPRSGGRDAAVMAAIEANGITIEYDVRGEGDPLLLVMGLGAQLIDWPDEFVDLLVGSGFQVIRFDNRDAGFSTEFHWTPPSRARSAAALLARHRPKAGYLIADMAADGAGLLRALDLGPAHVV